MAASFTLDDNNRSSDTKYASSESYKKVFWGILYFMLIKLWQIN